MNLVRFSPLNSLILAALALNSLAGFGAEPLQVSVIRDGTSGIRASRLAEDVTIESEIQTWVQFISESPGNSSQLQAPKHVSVVLLRRDESIRNLFDSFEKIVESRQKNWSQWIEVIGQLRDKKITDEYLFSLREQFFCDWPLAHSILLHRFEYQNWLESGALLQHWQNEMERKTRSFLERTDYLFKGPHAFAVGYPNSDCGVLVVRSYEGWKKSQAVVLHEVAHWFDFSTRTQAEIQSGLAPIPTFDETWADLLTQLYLRKSCFTDDQTQSKKCYRDLSGPDGGGNFEVFENPYRTGVGTLRTVLWNRLHRLSLREAYERLFQFRKEVLRVAKERTEILKEEVPISKRLQFLVSVEDEERRLKVEGAILKEAFNNVFETKK